MKKFLFFALALMATCTLFNSCTKNVQSQPLVEWGFENDEKPGTIDPVPNMRFTYKYAYQAIYEEIKNDANWEIQEDLVAGGVIARTTPTTEANLKKELTAIFDTAIKKAEDTMKEMNYEAQPQKITILAQYKFIMSESQLTTLKFTIPLYYTPEEK